MPVSGSNRPTANTGPSFFSEGRELRIFGVVTACIHQFAAPKVKK